MILTVREFFQSYKLLQCPLLKIRSRLPQTFWIYSGEQEENVQNHRLQNPLMMYRESGQNLKLTTVLLPLSR